MEKPIAVLFFVMDDGFIVIKCIPWFILTAKIKNYRGSPPATKGDQNAALDIPEGPR